MLDKQETSTILYFKSDDYMAVPTGVLMFYLIFLYSVVTEALYISLNKCHI